MDLIPDGCPFTSNWLTNVDGMKDMWCSSTAQLLSTSVTINTDMNGKI